ncbi:MAG: LD-carboxypeptidase, partial [Usitatibacteraceae bacterium]
MNPGSYNAPRPLLPGASIGLFAPSGVINATRTDAAVACLAQHGFRVVLSAGADRQWRYFAGTDEE